MERRIRRGLIAAALIVALGLAGCGQIASSVRAGAAQMWTPCPGTDVGPPIWSPDGTEVAYVITPRQGVSALYVTNTITRAVRRIAEVPASPSLRPEWSPDGSQILMAYDSGGSPTMALFDLDGTTHVLPDTIAQYPESYRWSPGGDYIAVTYEADTGPYGELYVYSRDGDLVWKVSDSFPDARFTTGVAWSPDGSQLALVTNERTLVLTTVQGEEFRRLISPDPSGGSERRIGFLEWSPDGTRIAFSTHEGSHAGALNVIRTDGADLRVVDANLGASARWLPDSSGFVFVTSAYDIATASADGSVRSVLMPALALGVSYTFSPDGSTMVYQIGGQYGYHNVIVSSVDGTGARELYHNPGNRRCFRWPF